MKLYKPNEALARKVRGALSRRPAHPVITSDGRAITARSQSLAALADALREDAADIYISVANAPDIQKLTDEDGLLVLGIQVKR